MNLIDKLDGYDKAKEMYVAQLKAGLAPYGYEEALLEYRREHNIFEVGDKVVFKECSGIGGASDAIDLMSVQGIDAFGVRMTNGLCPWVIQIRHATPEEIQAGRRL